MIGFGVLAGSWEAEERQGAGGIRLTQVETDLARGEWTDPRAGRVSFAEWAGRWQETTTNLRPNTRARHGYLLRRLMLPAFGDTALADMAGRDAAIAAALDELIEAASTLA
ncbi:MAG TPA: hypothetical protein VN907_04970, partial [Actinomycetes bacterium]|nr:hypothetical protein [Actinomycetes bacterium]